MSSLKSPSAIIEIKKCIFWWIGEPLGSSIKPPLIGAKATLVSIAIYADPVDESIINKQLYWRNARGRFSSVYSTIRITEGLELSYDNPSNMRFHAPSICKAELETRTMIIAWSVDYYDYLRPASNNLPTNLQPTP